jgi:hypothetical protein
MSFRKVSKFYPGRTQSHRKVRQSNELGFTDPDIQKLIKNDMTPTSMRTGLQAALCISPLMLILNYNLKDRRFGKDSLIEVRSRFTYFEHAYSHIIVSSFIA